MDEKFKAKMALIKEDFEKLEKEVNGKIDDHVEDIKN